MKAYFDLIVNDMTQFHCYFNNNCEFIVCGDFNSRIEFLNMVLQMNPFLGYYIYFLIIYIYIYIIDIGYFPETWSEGFIVPLHKKGDFR